MRYTRYVPSPELQGVQASNELYVLLSENAQLRRAATDLMLETALLREMLATEDSSKPKYADCDP